MQYANLCYYQQKTDIRLERKLALFKTALA